MKTLHIIFKPSRILSLLLGLISVAVLVILILLPMLWQLKLLLVLFVLLAFVYALCMHGLRVLPWSPVAVSLNTKNELKLIRRDGRQMLNLALCKDSVVTPYLTVVHCKPADASGLAGMFLYCIVLLPDAIEPDSFRQLRVWLRWGADLHKSKQNP